MYACPCMYINMNENMHVRVCVPPRLLGIYDTYCMSFLLKLPLNRYTTYEYNETKKRRALHVNGKINSFTLLSLLALLYFCF